MTQSKSFLNNFSKAMKADKPQESLNQPLSNKMGINTSKKTALQQGVLQSLSQPQGLMPLA